MSDLKNLIDVKKVAAEIASDLFTTGVGRKYTHLSMNNEAELGWCEKAVADRIERGLLALMDDEEPMPVGCEGPFPDKKGEYAASKQEPAPKWEPGTVIAANDPHRLIRLDECIEDIAGSPLWKYTYLEYPTCPHLVGKQEKSTFIVENYKIHRLPTEFLRGDWVQRASDPPFKVARTGATSPAGTYWVFSDDVPRRQELNKALVHVPPPKEEKADQEEHSEEDIRLMEERSKQPCVIAGAVETSEKPENPFKGRHWDEVARDANREDALAETLCIKDLRDELDRQAGRKP